MYNGHWIYLGQLKTVVPTGEARQGGALVKAVLAADVPAPTTAPHE